jgi:hypothetical protein
VVGMADDGAPARADALVDPELLPAIEP